MESSEEKPIHAEQKEHTEHAEHKEQKVDSELNKRTDKIKNWFKDPYNLALVGILVAALAIRLYYFFLTLDQAVWWDEGEYMLRVKHLVLGTPQTGFFVGRELFTPYFWAAIYAVFKSEIAIRFIQVIISTLTVWAAFLLGKEVYNKKIGLLASVFMTVFWLHLFFTCRLLTYLYAPLLYTLALALFWKGYCSDSPNKNKYLFWAFAIITIGIGVYYSVAFAALTILLYLLLTEKLAFLKNKSLWKCFLLSLPFLLLSFIPSYIVQGSIIPRLGQVAEIEATQSGAGLAGLFTYTNMLPRLLLVVWLCILIVSLVILLGRIILSIDLIVRNKPVGSVKNDLFIFLSALIPFALFTWLSMTAGDAQGAQYDAWILPTFPAMFVFMSRFISEVKKFAYAKLTSSALKKLVVVIIAIIITFSVYNHVAFADQTIKNKLPSYYNLKPAGEWLKEHTAPGDIIASSAVTEITYYSERETWALRSYDTEAEFVKAIIDEKKPKYIAVSIWEWEKDWAYKLQDTKLMNLTIAQVYFTDSAQKQPDVIIYQVNY